MKKSKAGRIFLLIPVLLEYAVLSLLCIAFMRIVQSLWTKDKNFELDGFGWVSPKFHLMSLALSVYTLRQFYDEVELYTDENGYEYLIKRMRLPYSKVHVVLDSLNEYDGRLWALAKLKTYSLQDKPFLHVDGDVYVWERFSKLLLNQPYIAQNLEHGTEYFEKIFDNIDKNLIYCPDFIVEEKNRNPIVKYYNAGIFGGNDFLFFQEFAKDSISFIEKNVTVFDKISIPNFNIYIEQYFFYCMLTKRGKTASCLFSFVADDLLYRGFGEFESVPNKRKYIHLMGNYKKSLSVCRLLEARLREEFPEAHYRILELLDLNKPNVLIGEVREWQKSICNIYKSNKNISGYRQLVDRDKEVYLRRTLSLISKIEGENVKLTSIKDIQRKVEASNSALLKDAFQYECKILEFVNSSDLNWSYDYLVAKGVLSNQYYKLLDELECDYLLIKRRKDLEVINSKWNWSSLESIQSHELAVSVSMTLAEGEFATLLSQSDAPYEYFECPLDQFDVVIIEIISEPIAFGGLLKSVANYFDSNELEQNMSEFKELISGRLKKLNYYGCFDLVDNLTVAECGN